MTSDFKWFVYGKHPAFADYFSIGDQTHFAVAYKKWVTLGYQHVIVNGGPEKQACSYQFWTRGDSKTSLAIGLLRSSSDKLGRPFPLLIIGTVQLPCWQNIWHTFTSTLENAWTELEKIAGARYQTLQNIATDLAVISLPDPSESQGMNPCPESPPQCCFYRGMRGEKYADPLHRPVDHTGFCSAVECRNFPGSLKKGCGLSPESNLARQFLLWCLAMNPSALGTSPITAENPAGEDIRYQPVFEDLQAEVDKLSSPSAAAEFIDWQKISTLAADILSTQSKDLLVASYFCVAQIHLSRIQGLELGLQIYRDLLENFWDSLFPQMRRLRGRIAAIEWWIEKSESAIQQISPDTINDAIKDRVRALCNRLDEIMEKYLPDSSLATHPILRAVEEIPSGTASSEPVPADTTESEAPEPPEAAPSSLPQQSPQPEPLPPTNPSQPRTEADTEGSMDSLLQNMQHTASTLLEQDLSNPLPYRLLRFSIWSTLDGPPPVAGDNKTLIPPPAPYVVTTLQDLFNSGDWSALVTASEYRLPEYIFWLDLNRFSTIALERMGPSYRKASECLAQETGFFLTRFPGLTALNFSNGTPYASQEAVEWLQSISLSRTAQPFEPIPMTGGNDSEPIATRLTEAVQQALALIQEKNPAKAIAIVQQEMRLAFSVKDKMLWRLALCKILIHSKNADLAVPHFDRALEDIRTYRLEEWDPIFALQVLKAIWAGFQEVSDTTAKERAALVLFQIARLDPVEALRMGK